MAEKQTKFIFVTGGVVSGLGKETTPHRWAVCSSAAV